jgi:hypothetical protein
MNHQYLDAKEERDPLHVYGAYIICECTLEYEDFRTCHWEAVACCDCKQPFSEKLLRARETANKLKNI